MYSLADFQFPILPWEEFGFVEPRVHAVFGQAGIECADGVTVRVSVAEEDFEGAFGFGHFQSLESISAAIVSARCKYSEAATKSPTRSEAEAKFVNIAACPFLSPICMLNIKACE